MMLTERTLEQPGAQIIEDIYGLFNMRRFVDFNLYVKPPRVLGLAARCNPGTMDNVRSTSSRNRPLHTSTRIL